MKLLDYLQDKLIFILTNLLVIIVIYILLILFSLNKILILFIMIIIIFNFLLGIIIDYVKRKRFYDSFSLILKKLDKKYLITEMIKSSSFLEGKLLLDYLYEIDKSFHEEVNLYKYSNYELKEYIELWCHEIKTPVATSKLIVENNKNKVTLNILEELENIEDYIEQVLYYFRSDVVEKDYLITDVKLEKVINTVIKRNKKSLVSKNIKIYVGKIYDVKSDSKWLEFILNQILVNSIKYSKDKKAYIKIYAKENKNNVILFIEDNGIGISSSDIDKVFDKGFTGENGRKKYNSTGIGLYLVKKLTNKLDHEIEIKSELNNFTIASIIFPKSNMIEDVSKNV